ncbi:MAG: phosphatase PAP2 family protein [Roseburia sp.]|nr:phosphatase PAP2 family protein [Roseburia sp.]
MKKNGKRLLITGSIWLVAFVVWTLLIQTADVQPVGVNGTDIGFATLNSWFHKWTGVHLIIYNITDWLGLVPIFVCVIFGGMGFAQLVKRRSLLKVDYDILVLGVYYIIVIGGYLVFEMIPINYRPILIEGIMEASYPSSTTLLVLCVVPTLMEQVNRRMKSAVAKKVIFIASIAFSAYMVLGRLVSGVHWFTDIVGAIMLSTGLFCIYKAVVLLGCKAEI